MAFNRDVFISYAHVDNDPLTADEHGWVSTFGDALQKRLAQLLGRKPDIWRDQKLQGNDIFGDEIVSQFSRLKVLLSVVSPRYLDSEWCRKELHEFYASAQKSGGVSVGNKSRIFKIIKTPVPREKQPVEMQTALGYEFFQSDGDRFREFVLEKGSPTYNQFIERFEDVAQDLSKLIAMFDGDQPPVPSPHALENAIYLASTTSDRSSERDSIRRDLEQRGYAVLPDKDLPVDAGFRETVVGYMKRCKLSIHLIGNKYGLIPEDEQRSMLEIQLELSQENTMTRLVWLPENLSSTDARQQQLISRLQEHGVATRGSDMLRGKLEDLKTAIVDKLKKPAVGEGPQSHADAERSTPRVCLLYDESDLKGVTRVDDYLFQKGIETLKPVFEGSESERREIYTENFRICDGALIYCDRAPESWLMFKMNDLRKAPGYREGKPLKVKSVILAGEKKDFKERFRSLDALVVKQFEGFSGEELAPCIAPLL